jgi:hypothetical protein
MSDQNPYGPPPQDGSYGYPQQPPNPAPGYGYPQQPPNPAPGYGYPQQPPNPAPGYGYPQADSGYGYPQQPPGAAGGPMLVSIGDIAVMGDAIMTPAGQMPLKGAAWTVTDMSRTEERMPTYAVVLAIIFFLACFLGLLFLLIKEKRTSGHVQVTVNSGGKYHSTMIPVSDPMAVTAIINQVNYARSLSM